jgi:hypothetical protein
VADEVCLLARLGSPELTNFLVNQFNNRRNIMARSDFVVVSFNQTFNASNVIASETFTVEGTPTGPAYLLIQARDVEQGNHQIRINGVDLPDLDIPSHSNNSQEWFTWMDVIPAGRLESGQNTITIRRVANEDFRVNNVAIHWREPSSFPLGDGMGQLQAEPVAP